MNETCSAYFSDERAETYAFTDYYAITLLGFYNRGDMPLTYNTLEDLKSYKIGMVKGYVNTP